MNIHYAFITFFGFFDVLLCSLTLYMHTCLLLNKLYLHMLTATLKVICRKECHYLLLTNWDMDHKMEKFTSDVITKIRQMSLMEGLPHCISSSWRATDNYLLCVCRLGNPLKFSQRISFCLPLFSLLYSLLSFAHCPHRKASMCLPCVCTWQSWGH